MKRHTILSGALAFLLSVACGTSRAVAAPQTESFPPNAEYPDVPRGHWAYEDVTWGSQYGILEGHPDGRFNGDRPLTRYEFVVAMTRFYFTCGIGPVPDRPLKYQSLDDLEKARLLPPTHSADVPRGHWAYDAVQLVQRFGLMQGNPQSQFLGDKPMTRYEFAAALRRLNVIKDAKRVRQ